MSEGARELLRRARVEVAPGLYSLVSIDEASWRSLLSQPDLSPSMADPFMVFKDGWEVTMLLNDEDFAKMRQGLAGAKVQTAMRLLTIDLPMGFEEVGVIAELSAAMAASGIPLLALSAFTRDHLLVKQDDLPRALAALGPLIDAVC